MSRPSCGQSSAAGYLRKSIDHRDADRSVVTHGLEFARGILQRHGLADEMLRLEQARHDHLQHGTVVLGLHTMASEDLELFPDDLFHWKPRPIVVTREEPDLDVTAAFAEALNRVCCGGRTAEGID